MTGIGISNMIIMRTYFQSSIPGEMLEAGKVDGITDIGYLLKIALPLAKPVISVITLYYLVGHWNDYFGPLIYLRDEHLQPLQLILRGLLSSAKVDTSAMTDLSAIAKISGAEDVMKYSLIVVSTLPMLILYPFVQKFFDKGVMMGSLKG
jgi:multiple sugar transport system permease protein/putative aldouronate transport system permease protein